MVPGSLSGSATEIFQEGLRIPLIRLGRNDRFYSNVVELILRNVRVPHETRGDMQSQLACIRVASRRIGELLDRYGKDTVLAIWEEILNISERRMRELIAELPKETVFHESYLDNDGVEPIQRRIRVTVTVKDDEIEVDYTGTAPQSKGPINITEGLAHGFAYIGIKASLDPSMRIDAGVFRCVKVIAPKGTMVNAMPPAAGGGTGEVGQAAVATMVAMSKLVPDRVSAEESTAANHNNFGGIDRRFDEPRHFVYYDYPSKGSGARATKDGMDWTRDLRVGNINMQSIEVVEQCFPVQFTRFELREDSGGAGKFRGGLGGVREWRTASEGTLSVLADHGIVPTAGYFGGYPGALCRYELLRGNETLLISPEFRSKVTGFRVHEGDIIRVHSQAGSGWSDPLEREPERVLDDVLDHKVSVAQAREMYGVVIDAGILTLDATATADRRAAMAAQRTYLRVRKGGAPALQDGVRVGWVSPALETKGVHKEGDMGEAFFANRPNPLRVRIKVKSDLPDDVLMLDEEAWRDLKVEEDQRVLWHGLPLDL